MKRWLAGWLSVVILFSGGFCLAEAPQEKERADLEETVVTVEGENLGTVSENLVFLIKMIGDKDVQDLLKNEEVKSVAWEIATRVFLWMYENRPVTMKILAELGIGEGDRHCVEKLWDSAERIHAALDAFSDSDEGVKLMMEFDALTNDPDILLSMNEFLDLLTSEDLTVLLNAIPEVVNESIAERKDSDGSLTQQALDRKAMPWSSDVGSSPTTSLSDRIGWCRFHRSHCRRTSVRLLSPTVKRLSESRSSPPGRK